VEFGDHAQPAVLKNRSRKLQLGAGTARVAADERVLQQASLSEMVWSEVRRCSADVGAFERRGLVFGEVDVECGDGVGEVVLLGCSNDGGVDNWGLEHPGQCDGGHADPAVVRDALDGVDDGLV
jgi:hypothetical protein